MEKYQEQSQFNREAKKLQDWLPDGTDDKKHILKEDTEWHGLERRLGQPRILKHIYFPEVLDWIQQKYKNNPDDFSYFEAGCGHGNDLRAIRKELDGRGHFLGVDISRAEIMHGLEFYQQQENTEESRKLFAQGDLRNLKHINIWDNEKGDFSQSAEIKDKEFDYIYMEAVLHGLGHSKKTYQEKRENAQKMLNELARICKKGGKFLGRASVFGPGITKEQQFDLMRKTNNWRFIPEAKELEEMLKQAEFTNIKITLNPHERAETDPNKKNIQRFSFLAEK